MTLTRSHAHDEAGMAQEAQELIANILARGFVSLAVASKETGVPLSTLAHAVRAGRVPAVKVLNNRWFVRPSAVRIEFQDAGTVSAKDTLQALVQRGLISPQTKIRRPNAKRAIKAVAIGGESIVQELQEGRR